MSKSSVDDLIGALFPGEKLPPGVGQKVSTTNSWGQQQQKQTITDNFDDDDDSPIKKKNIQQQQQKPPTSALHILPTTTTTTTNAGSNFVVPPKKTFSHNPNAEWPTLPKNLIRSCEEGTCILTNHISQRDIVTHRRVLFPSATTTQEQILQERDSSIANQITGDVAYCAYMRCKKCGHPVVRLQNAYVISKKQQQQVSTPATSAPIITQSAQTQQQQQPKKKTKTHSFDDSSEEEEEGENNSQSILKTPNTTTSNNNNNNKLLDDMYMLCRNHYPDFLALERTGQMKRVPEAVGSSAECALYWCQCTIASCCFKEKIPLRTIAIGNQNGKLLDVSSNNKLGGDTPYSSTEICWECVGHHQVLKF